MGVYDAARFGYDGARRRVCHAPPDVFADAQHFGRQGAPELNILAPCFESAPIVGPAGNGEKISAPIARELITVKLIEFRTATAAAYAIQFSHLADMRLFLKWRPHLALKGLVL